MEVVVIYERCEASTYPRRCARLRAKRLDAARMILSVGARKIIVDAYPGLKPGATDNFTPGGVGVFRADGLCF